MVLDFTTSANLVARHIPGAWWLTRSQLRQALEAIPPAQRYVVTCGSSLLAGYAVPEVAALTGKPVQLLYRRDAGVDRRRVCRWRMATAASPSSAVTAIVVRTKEPIIPAEAMQAYLEWEYGLVDQLARDGTHGFRVL